MASEDDKGVDITGDGGVFKRIIKEGDGTKPTAGDYVTGKQAAGLVPAAIR